MALLVPFEPAPQIAVGVSGGADSMAVAWLAANWVRERGGSLLALIVDHGLREESGSEATVTAARLGERGIGARILVVKTLARGPGLAERARAARFAVLEAACAEAGILHLLLGHHAGDQAETLLIRRLGGSGPIGMAGMARLVEIGRLRLLRPLLAMPAARLRATLRAAGIAWVEDPSNADASALRPRLRLLRCDAGGIGSATAALVSAAAAAARERAAQERGAAIALAEQAVIRPEGFALLAGQPLPTAALAALLRVIAGARFAPATRSLTALAAAPRPATLGGARLLPAGRVGSGLLVVREPAAMAPSVLAQPGAVWDGRFRLGEEVAVPSGATLGALGADAARLRRFSTLPAAVLQTLPAIRLDAALFAVPHLLYPGCHKGACLPLLFSPPSPAAAAVFVGDA
jgi:tRNA(Ile)-lysidine synthase